MTSDNSTSVLLVAGSIVTALIAWIFKYKIAELVKKRQKTPTEVLFEGYERLLKQYQEALDARDDKVIELEQSFDRAQKELDKSKALIQVLKREDERKQEVITSLELKLSELKTLYSTGT